jgi:hypothetical protein
MRRYGILKNQLLVMTIIAVMISSVPGCIFLVKVHEISWPGVRARTEAPLYHIGDIKKFESVDFRPGKDTIEFSLKMPDGSVLTYDHLTPEAITPYVMPDDWSTDGNCRSVEVTYDNGWVTAYFEDGKLILVTVFAWPRQPVSLGQSVPAIGNRDGTKVFPLPITKDELIELFGEPTKARTYLFST